MRFPGQPGLDPLPQALARRGGQGGGEPHGLLRIGRDAALGGRRLGERGGVEQAGEGDFQRMALQRGAAGERGRRGTARDLRQARRPAAVPAQGPEARQFGRIRPMVGEDHATTCLLWWFRLTYSELAGGDKPA